MSKRIDYVLTLANGFIAKATIHIEVAETPGSDGIRQYRTVEARYSCDGLIGGPYPSQDMALSQLCQRLREQHGSGVMRVQDKSKIDGGERLRARIAELEAIVRKVASVNRLVDFGDGNGFVCPFCPGDLEGEPPRIQHEDDCIWLMARMALGMDVP